jgi:hypothetical protein
MNREGYVRLTTENLEESLRARSEGRKLIFRVVVA